MADPLFEKKKKFYDDVKYIIIHLILKINRFLDKKNKILKKKKISSIENQKKIKNLKTNLKIKIIKNQKKLKFQATFQTETLTIVERNHCLI